MNLNDAFKGLAFPGPGGEWSVEIGHAQRGDFRPLIASLRSDKQISPKAEAILRETIALALGGNLKRRRGRPTEQKARATNQIRRMYRNPRLFLAADYVARYKRVQRRRYGRLRGVEREALEKASKKFSINEESLFNFIHRSKAPRPKIKRT